MFNLGINIKGMKVSPERRQVREIINTPQGSIEVYEPTMDDIAVIIDMQVDQDFGEVTGVVSFDGIRVIKELFPLLTNIEFGELSDEELEEIVENPTVHLLITQQVLAQIVSESNKLYVERIKTEMMNTESIMAQVSLMNSIPTSIVEQAKRDGKVSELMGKVQDASDEFEKVSNMAEKDRQEVEELFETLEKEDLEVGENVVETEDENTVVEADDETI